jgi:hypothetical protein
MPGKLCSVLRRSKLLLRNRLDLRLQQPRPESPLFQNCALPLLVSTISQSVRDFISRREKSNHEEGIEEQFYVLKKGGTVNGLVFPLWDELPSGLSANSLYQFVD